MVYVRNAGMDQRTPGSHFNTAIAPLRYFASLQVIAAACFMMQATGCVHRAAEEPSAPQRSRAVEKQAPSGSTQTPHVEQPEKARAAEKKSPVLKDKKSATSAGKAPGRKSDQPEESPTDTFVPPPPLKPPAFGGAGG